MRFEIIKRDWFIGLVITLAAALAATSSAVHWLEWQTYDLGMRLSAERKANDRITVIALDDASLDRYGNWPWPPGLFTQLMARMHRDGGPQAIGVLPPFDFPRNDQGLAYIRQLRALKNPGWSDDAASLLVRAEASLDDTEDLAASMQASGNVVLGLGQRLGGPRRGRADMPPVLIDGRLTAVGGAPLKQPSLDDAGYLAAVPHWPERWTIDDLTPQPPAADPLPPMQLLGDSASGVGVLPLDLGSVGVREQPLVYRYRGLYLPSFALLMAARTLDVDNAHLAVDLGEGISFGGRQIPTDPQLRVWPYFYRGGSGTPFRVYSFADVLDGKVPASDFQGQTVLIGPTSARLTNFADVPSGERLPPVMIEANVVSSLLNGYVYQVRGWAVWTEALALLLVGLYLMFWLPRVRPWVGVALTLVFAALLANTQFVLMNTMSLRVQLVVPLLALLLGHIAMVIKDLLAGRLGRVRADLAETRLKLGQAYQAHGQLDEAWDVLRRCAPSDAALQALFGLGLDYERKRRFPRALAVFRHVRDLAPEFPDVDRRIGRIQELEKHFLLGAAARNDPIETAVLDDGEMSRPVIGRYEVEKIVGRGAMGVVYMGRDQRIGRTVAVKTLALAQEFEGDQLRDVTERFFREAETAGRLNHPNIVTIFDVGEEHDLAYIAMDFLTGENLQAYTKDDKRLPLAKVLDLGAQVAEALDYAHEHNVVHRDIKPANIIYDASNGKVKVTDFGVACVTDTSKTRTGTILGSPSYMAPEQIEGKRIDGRADLFSLGVTLFELITGELPFVGEPVATLMYRITNQPHPDIRSLRPGLPPCVKLIIDTALAKDPAKRFQSGLAMAQALRRCMQDAERSTHA